MVVVSRGPERRKKIGNSKLAVDPLSASRKCQKIGNTTRVEPCGSSRR